MVIVPLGGALGFNRLDAALGAACTCGAAFGDAAGAAYATHDSENRQMITVTVDNKTIILDFSLMVVPLGKKLYLDWRAQFLTCFKLRVERFF